MYYISRTAAMIISLHVFEDDTVAKVTVSKANLDEFCFGLLGPAPFFVASLFCFEAKRKSGWGICGSFLVVLLFFVWFCFRDDLPKFLDHTCPCTLLLFIAYAIVRTEPSATSAKPEKKNMSIFQSLMQQSSKLMQAFLVVPLP